MIKFVLDLEEQTIYIYQDENLIETMGVSFDTELENGYGGQELLFACQLWLDQREMFETEYKVLIRLH